MQQKIDKIVQNNTIIKNYLNKNNQIEIQYIDTINDFDAQYIHDLSGISDRQNIYLYKVLQKKSDNHIIMTIYHQLSHSTGKRHRLNRDGSTILYNINKDIYNQQQAVACLSSIMLFLIDNDQKNIPDQMIKSTEIYLWKLTKWQLNIVLVQSVTSCAYIINDYNLSQKDKQNLNLVQKKCGQIVKKIWNLY